MSFFKNIWGGGQKGSSKSKKENSKPKGKDEIWAELTPEEKAEAEKLPFVSSDKKSRNLSISRSGRHKYKAKQRSALGQDDLYSTHNSVAKGATASSQQPSTSHSSQGGAASSSHSRGGSYGNQGSLGRSSAGQCAVEESTKRYSGQTKMASQPTAV